MLVLARKLGQRIRISDDVTITVLKIDRGRVRLGFEGPRHVRIDREEVYQDIEQHGRRVSNSLSS